MFAGKIRPIDGIDAWPTLTGAAASLGRDYLPTTNQSPVSYTHLTLPTILLV